MMLTDEQRSFLKGLQEELNTQDTVGQADPRFWVVMCSEYRDCHEGMAEKYALYNRSCDLLGYLDCPIDEDENPNLSCYPVRRTDYITENTMFLTLREAEEHIRLNGYHYKNPRPFAMTAWRSPQVKQLIKILHEADWDDAE